MVYVQAATKSLPCIQSPRSGLVRIWRVTLGTTGSNIYGMQCSVRCPGAQSAVLFPATVETVWAVVRANVSDQLNVTVGWDDRVASYGKMKQFEVDFITESAVQPKESRIFKASTGVVFLMPKKSV